VKLTRLILWLLVAAMALPALADDVVYENIYLDPSTLHVGNPPTAGDPNQFNLTFEVLQNSGGVGALNNPWQIFLAVPNVTVLTNPFGAVTATASAGGSATAAFVGRAGVMGPGGEAYSTVGVQGPYDMSNNFGNWAGAESSISGITATQFGIYQFNVNATLAAKDTVTFSFASLPTGTIAIAYGQTSSTSSSQTCTGKGKNRTCTTTYTTTYQIYDTPWTEAGYSTYRPPPPPTPEPASMLLLGAGMAGLAGLKKVRR
jgi:hypothetical protein